MSKEIPILFSTDMVKAILDGNKTMTRRIVKPQPDDSGLHNHTAFPMSLDSDMKGWWGTTADTGESKEFPCRYGNVGDILWVRENMYQSALGVAMYSASGRDSKHEYVVYEGFNKEERIDWDFFTVNRANIPSIYMPKKAARIWLEVTGVRVDQLLNITEQDTIKEGIEGDLVTTSGSNPWRYKNYFKHGEGDPHLFSSPIQSFCSLWSKINGDESWKSNPWVWVIEFKVLSTTGKP